MSAALTVALVAAVGALCLSLWRHRQQRRAMTDRLSRVVLQLDRDAARAESEMLGDALTRLESAAERTAIERNLVAEERSRLQLAINELRVGLVVVDHTGEVIARNEVADQYLSPRHATALVAAAVNDLMEVARDGRSAERMVNLTGPPSRVIRVGAQPLFDGQRPLGAVAVIEDRTEGTRIDQVRRDFVANLSHELRTPVGAIALLAETLAGEPDGSVRERLTDRISAEADRVGHIIDDLLELSRVELDGSPRRDLVDVEALLAEAADQVQSRADALDVKVLRLPAASALRLVGDRGQLLRALTNLLDNAIKYSDPDTVVELGAQSRSSQVDIVVRDQGIGIPQHDHERVFERFYRVDKARSRSTGGTGLGLSIVRHVVANHGGEILLRSREGEGSTFTLRLPSGTTS